MAKFEINRNYSSQTHKQTVEANKYVQEGEFFVFYGNSSVKVLTVSAGLVRSIDLVEEK